MVAIARFLFFTVAQAKQRVFYTRSSSTKYMAYFYCRPAKLLLPQRLYCSQMLAIALQRVLKVCWGIYCCSALNYSHTSWQKNRSLCGHPRGCNLKWIPCHTASGCKPSLTFGHLDYSHGTKSAKPADPYRKYIHGICLHRTHELVMSSVITAF